MNLANELGHHFAGRMTNNQEVKTQASFTIQKLTWIGCTKNIDINIPMFNTQ